MSTKIYDGFYLREGVTPFDILGEITTDWENIGLRLYSESVLRTLPYGIEGRDLVDGVIASSRARAAMEKSAMRNFGADLSGEVIFFYDEVSARYVGRIFTEVEEYREHLFGLAGVGEYSYWNNTSRPESVSGAAWEERREVWERVLESGSYAGRGLSWKVPTERLDGALVHARGEGVGALQALGQHDRVVLTTDSQSEVPATEEEDGGDYTGDDDGSEGAIGSAVSETASSYRINCGITYLVTAESEDEASDKAFDMAVEDVGYIHARAMWFSDPEIVDE
jgi:hypothetical protein